MPNSSADIEISPEKRLIAYWRTPLDAPISNENLVTKIRNAGLTHLKFGS
jgi:hypothetical protein